MKNNFSIRSVSKFQLLIACLLVNVLFISCEKEPHNHNNNNGMIWDVTPLNVIIYVQDSDGNDLLSPQFSDNILDDDIYVTYNDMKFPLGVDMSSETMSRAYLAVLSGLHHSKYGNDYYLIFGEFDGATDWNDSFVIHWGDGTEDKIVFQHDFEWSADGSPDFVSSALYLNDKKVENKLIIIR